MTRDQRRVHAYMWMILGPLLLCGLVVFVSLRPTPGGGPSTIPAGAAP
jgi:hypothetical protein